MVRDMRARARARAGAGAFVSAAGVCVRVGGARRTVRAGVCAVRASASGGETGGEENGGAGAAPNVPAPKTKVSSETPAARKLVRNAPAAAGDSPALGDGLYAEPSAGEAGGPEVGAGLGPRRAQKDPSKIKDKRVTKAAAAQGSMGFADAWAAQNRDRGGSRFDVWAIIGLLTVLTPVVILVGAILTGVIPGFVTPAGYD